MLRHNDAASTVVGASPSTRPAWLTAKLFSHKIQPLLAGVPTSVIRSRIGVSRWYASRIRQGYRPHPRHWEALARLAGIFPDVREINTVPSGGRA